MWALERVMWAGLAGFGGLLSVNVAAAAPLEFTPTPRDDGLRVWAAGVVIGAASGGEETVVATYADGTHASMKAGQGAFVGGGLRFTPLWLAKLLGLGLALDAGWKGTGIYADNGNIRLTRVPITLTARGSLALAETFAFVAGVGPTIELSPHLYGDGVASFLDVHFDPPIGAAAEAGLMWEALPHVGVELTGNARFIRYHWDGGSLDGNSLGFQLGLHVLL